MAMARRLIIFSVIAGLMAAPLCVAQPLHVPPPCPLKTRCCRVLPAQPGDAVKPQAPHVAIVQAPLPLIAEAPPAAVAAVIPDAPVREVPTRTVVLRI
jgi:hypothetical protein